MELFSNDFESCWKVFEGIYLKVMTEKTLKTLSKA